MRAQVLASLNHRSIAAIYGIEESGGVRALVMEQITAEGGVKVLDFRLAKVIETESSMIGDVSASPTLTLDATRAAAPLSGARPQAAVAGHRRGAHRDLITWHGRKKNGPKFIVPSYPQRATVGEAARRGRAASRGLDSNPGADTVSVMAVETKRSR